jgi:hypothetical protein
MGKRKRSRKWKEEKGDGGKINGQG